MSDSQSASAYIPFSGMSVANDSPVESLHIPWRDSDLQAKLERYQMVVSERHGVCSICLIGSLSLCSALSVFQVINM